MKIIDKMAIQTQQSLEKIDKYEEHVSWKTIFTTIPKIMNLELKKLTAKETIQLQSKLPTRPSWLKFTITFSEFKGLWKALQ
jgi:hypothetical protein